MVTTRRYTLADLPELPDDDRSYDILGGELVVRNVPDDNHAELLTELLDFLVSAQRAGYGRLYTSTRAVALDFPLRGEAARDVTHPDLFFVREGRDDLRGPRAFQGVPDLIIEILSPSTRAEHAPGGELWTTYQRNGVPYYWIVDAETRTVRQYALVGEPYAGGRYGEPNVLRPGDMLSSPLFPSVALPVATLFRRVRDRPDRGDAPKGRHRP